MLRANLVLRVKKGGSFWGLFLMLMAVPTVLALAGVVSSVVSLDTENLSHLLRYVLPDAVRNTIALVLGVGTLTTILGVSLAWLTAVCDFPMRRFFVWSLLLPMAIPGYVMAFAFVGFFEYTGSLQSGLRASGLAQLLSTDHWFPNIYSYFGVVLVLSLVLYPYIYMLVRNAFRTQGRRGIEVGRSLGLSANQSFIKVSLPLARPWIVGGLLLVVMETMADFGTVAIFNYDTLTTAIYKSWFSLYSVPAALQVASILLIFVVLMTLVERRSRKAQQYHAVSGSVINTRRITLQGWQKWAAALYCSFIFGFAFVLPCAQLLAWAIPNLATELTQQFWLYVVGSASLATIAMLLIATLALLMAFAARTHDTAVARIAVRISTLGYALPGTVLAIGLYAPVVGIDRLLQAMGAESNLLQGTMLVMLLAYSVRFMAVAFAPLESNMLRITPSLDAAARSMGVSGLNMLRRVHLPMVRGGLLTAMILVFVDVMKELPITLMTRPFGFNTLAVRIFELSSEGLWQRAALPAVAIVLVGLIPVILLVRQSDSDIARSPKTKGRKSTLIKAAQ